MTPALHGHYRLPLPHDGTWREVLNSDAATYGGSGQGNQGAIEARDGAAQVVLPTTKYRERQTLVRFYDEVVAELVPVTTGVVTGSEVLDPLGCPHAVSPATINTTNARRMITPRC